MTNDKEKQWKRHNRLVFGKTNLLQLLFGFIGITGCLLWQKKYTYSAREIEGVVKDSTFNVSPAEMLKIVREVLLDMGFEIRSEEENLVVTFPLYIEKEEFGNYAVEKVGKGYEPVSKDILYSDPSLELRCVIIPVKEGTKVKIKTNFEAFRKDLYYREGPDKKVSPKVPYEVEGDLIECFSTGRTEKAFFERISYAISKAKCE